MKWLIYRQAECQPYLLLQFRLGLLCTLLCRAQAVLGVFQVIFEEPHLLLLHVEFMLILHEYRTEVALVKEAIQTRGILFKLVKVSYNHNCSIVSLLS